MVTMIQEQKSQKRFLEPQYEPQGVVKTTSTGIGLVREAELHIPRPSKPYCSFEDWRRVIDMVSPSLLPEIAEEINDHDVSNAFKTLDIKVNDNPRFSTSDILNVKTGSEVEHEQAEVEHIHEVFNHCITQLPPVTSALIGGYLSEIRVYDKDNYRDNILPEGKRFGGLHRPYRRCIEVMGSCSCRINKNPSSYPCKNSSFSCMFLHELGHTVHNLYGFLRPGDHGYDYPSPRDDIESTGCITPLNLSERQSTFVYDIFRTYVYNHMDCYNNPHYASYGQEHPTESFACAFEILLRNGEEEIMDEYWHFHDVFTHLL